MNNLTLLPSNNLISALDSNNNSTLETGEIATLTNNLKFAQQINIPGPETLPTFNGSISGRNFIDFNRNGVAEVGEPGIAGFTIYIDLDNNNILDSSEPSTITDVRGFYRFNDLPPNTYILREVPQPGLVANQVSNPVTIPPGGFNAENINFGIAGSTFISLPGILQFSNPSYSVNEDGTTSREVMVTRTAGSTGRVDVSVLASDGTANAGTDYNATPINVSFLDGDTTPKTIRIPIINDSIFEPDETINLSLVRTTGRENLGVQSAAILIINSSDAPPENITGSIQGTKFNDLNRNGILEVGEPGIPGFTIYIDLDNNSTPDINEPSTLTDATGSYQFNGLPPNTYILREVQQPGFVATLVPNPVTISPVRVATQVPNPVTISPGRGFNAENINFGNARTVEQNGIPGILQFSNPSYSVNEDGTTIMEVMVTRTGGSLGTVDVTVLASDGTANAGTDYNATPITVSFIDGDTTPKPIRIPIINDSLFEPNETINLSLVNPTNGATLGVQTAATLIINRSDSGVPLNIDNLGNLQTVARDPLIRESGFDLSANALAIVSAQQGGSGNFIDPLINPGQVARGITYNEGQSIIINVANGFDQKFSFRYASPFAAHQVTIYDGVNGRGNVLASVQLPRTTDSNLTPGTYILESNLSSNLFFQGLGKSVILGNQPNKLVIGDISFG